MRMCYKMYATDERYPDYMGYGGSDGYGGGGAGGGGGGGGGGISTFGYRPYGEFLYTKRKKKLKRIDQTHHIQLERKMDFEFKVIRTQTYTDKQTHTHINNANKTENTKQINNKI